LKKLVTLATAAAAVLAIAAPASASEIRVSVAGKSAAQLNAEIDAAARTVCKREVSGSVVFAGAFKSCYRASLADAKSQLRQYAQASGMQVAAN
jgi:UrcA family protein